MHFWAYPTPTLLPLLGPSCLSEELLEQLLCIARALIYMDDPSEVHQPNLNPDPEPDLNPDPPHC